MKKIITNLLVFSMVFCLISLNKTKIEALDSPSEIVNYSELDNLPVYNNESEMTSEVLELFNKLVEDEVEKNKNEPGFNEVLFRAQVKNAFFGKLNIENDGLSIQARWTYTGIWISNSAAAAAINVAVGIALGGVASGGIKLALKSYVKSKGSAVAIATISRAVQNQILMMGFKQYFFITPMITSIVNNILDPGMAVAKFLDSRDKRPNNNRIDFA